MPAHHHRRTHRHVWWSCAAAGGGILWVCVRACVCVVSVCCVCVCDVGRMPITLYCCFLFLFLPSSLFWTHYVLGTHALQFYTPMSTSPVTTSFLVSPPENLRKFTFVFFFCFVLVKYMGKMCEKHLSIWEKGPKLCMYCCSPQSFGDKSVCGTVNQCASSQRTNAQQT